MKLTGFKNTLGVTKSLAIYNIGAGLGTNPSANTNYGSGTGEIGDDLNTNTFTEVPYQFVTNSGDNLGDHTATQDLVLGTNGISDSNSSTGTAGQVLSSTATGTDWVDLASTDLIQDVDGDTKIQVEESADEDKIRFDTDGSERMVIDNSGNVGIGTTSPTQNLSVNGTAGKTGGGSWSTFSDRRVKTDIQTYSKGLNEIMEINPVTFKYKENSGYSNTSKDYVGIIAQEIEQVLPSMVDQIDDSQGSSGLSDKRVFDSSELLWILINAVKELKTENDSLKEKLKQQGLIVD